MNRPLEILSRYLPYGLKVLCHLEDSDKDIGTLSLLDYEYGIGDVKIGNSKQHDIDIGDMVPILYGFDALAKPILPEGKIPAIEIAKLTTEDCDPLFFDEKAHLGTGFITVISKNQKYVVTIFKEWDVCVTDIMREEDLSSNHQALIQQSLISWHFAVGLGENEYIPKEVAP